MKVKLISYSKGLGNSNLLEDIAYIARVSNPGNQKNTATSEKLVRSLMKHKHWSPFEMVSVCMEIETTRDISKQILRHRSFSFQEFSQRYAEPDQLGTFILREARMQDETNRQNSVQCDNLHIAAFWENSQRNVISAVQMAYEYAIKSGIAKEQARVVLPEGCTPTRMYMNGTLRSWLHYIEIRSGVETQKEHREIALACAEELKEIFPMVSEFTS